MSLPAAIAIVGVSIAIGFVAMFYFLYRIFCILAAAMTGDGITMRRALGTAPKVQNPDEQSGNIVPEMPELGIHAMADSEGTMKRLRDKQDSGVSQNY